MTVALGVVVVTWTVFRPSATIISTGPWISVIDAILDRVEAVLPGLKHSRSALRAAGRPDVAAYFGAYLVCASALWLVGLALLGRLLGIVAASDLGRRGQMPEIVANAYPAKSTVRAYVWRFVYACQCWVLLLLALIAPLVVWHQSVTGTRDGMTRVWENVVTGMGAYVPGAVLFLVGAPMLAYFALWVRTALRVQRRENRRRMSQTKET
jgi:hypothetical protein